VRQDTVSTVTRQPRGVSLPESGTKRKSTEICLCSEETGAPFGRKGAPAGLSATVHLRLQYGTGQNGESAV
ncbi:MAG: hypothetical protein ACK5AN_07265, partial [Planctomyces sp.]